MDRDDSSPGSLRVGAVRYLNAKPLYFGLDRLAPGIRLEMDLPSLLADRLAGGSLDVALIPSVEYLRGAKLGYRIIPGLAIASGGPVRSVKLYSRVPFARIDRLALDEGSRTSQALARVWLDEAHGVRPSIVESLPMGVPVQESTADAVLLIGDRAMRDPDERFHAVVDLASAWRSLTGLPFVFALWVARSGIDLGDLPEALHHARAEGLVHVDQIAEQIGPGLGLTRDECIDYLTRNISYDLGEPEVAALRLFARKAAALGLAPEDVDLAFANTRRLPDLAARR
ncbi:menaquinone biosynthetic enzyme MqnA/MqnD family protein [Tautonia rosea]|uniref:menaquinone biosynthetic enzyme MqnA/MqnD family protein n=1 Tax=Tautonia rosea TaxID=2728037 RepID=UPI001473329F|nr:menaquinone biosynthesis protein [Tautonia rosea]